MVVIIGVNGVGKMMLMCFIFGVLKNQFDVIIFDVDKIGVVYVVDIVKKGIVMVFEGCKLFFLLSVEENLLIGVYGCKIDGFWSFDVVYWMFLVLKEWCNNLGIVLFGG